MSEIVISVENLGKKYRIKHQAERQAYVALRDVLADKTKGVARRLWSVVRGPWSRGPVVPWSGGPSSEDFWALRDVSFEVRSGEVVGIIGRNGAGKSTLLKILSRITEPTTGRVRIKGRVASLLEVGTGFHPELTGRENIFLNGAILGMTRAEITRKFDEIVAFAEVEKFLDTPVKRYSSGMYVRLAFAVAAHLEPEILIVDEVLAVGDAEFQRKCLGKMESVARGEGRTILFVSHNMAAVEALCSTGVVLDSGCLVANGGTGEMIRTYLARTGREGTESLRTRQDREGSGALRFSAVELADGSGRPVAAFQCGSDATLVLRFENHAGRDLRTVRVAIGVDNEFGQRVLFLDSTLLGADFETVPAGEGAFRVTMPRLSLLPGHYRFTIYATENGVIADWLKNAASFQVEGGDYFGTGKMPSAKQGLVLVEHAFHLSH